MKKSKVVLITGGSRGIGRATAIAFAKEGYDVCFTYNTNTDMAKSLLTELAQYGGLYQALRCDISQEAQVRQLVTDFCKKYSHLDVLVNNVGISIDNVFENKTVEDFQKIINVNLIGTFLVSKYFGEMMYANKKGKIINLSSTNGINTYYPMCMEYDASKAGINSLTHNLAMQFAPFVNVNAVAPGFIKTDTEINAMNDDFVKTEEKKIFVRRAGKPEEVADLILFLASEKADFINNEIIRIDGGIYGNN